MKMESRLNVLLSLLTISSGFVAAFDDDDLGLGIVNGNDATLGQFPHQVLFEAYAPNDGAMCGGSIIDEVTIVTAAHCIPDGVDEIQIYAGIIDADDLGQNRMGDLSSLKVHPQYNSPQELDNDLAIVKLTEPLEFNDIVKPIAYCQSKPAAGTQCMASGWGTAGPEAGAGESQQMLQFVPMQYYPKEQCNAGSTALCARAANGGGVCSGDSGGPLTCPDGNGNVCLLGVASYIVDRCGSGDGSDDVFADVTENKAFLNIMSTTTAPTTTSTTAATTTTTPPNATPDQNRRRRRDRLRELWRRKLRSRQNNMRRNRQNQNQRRNLRNQARRRNANNRRRRNNDRRRRRRTNPSK